MCNQIKSACYEPRNECAMTKYGCVQKWRENDKKGKANHNWKTRAYLLRHFCNGTNYRSTANLQKWHSGGIAYYRISMANSKSSIATMLCHFSNVQTNYLHLLIATRWAFCISNTPNAIRSQKLRIKMTLQMSTAHCCAIFKNLFYHFLLNLTAWNWHDKSQKQLCYTVYVIFSAIFCDLRAALPVLELPEVGT